jgi:hypothetical protein
LYLHVNPVLANKKKKKKQKQLDHADSANEENGVGSYVKAPENGDAPENDIEEESVDESE